MKSLLTFILEAKKVNTKKIDTVLSKYGLSFNSNDLDEYFDDYSTDNGHIHLFDDSSKVSPKDAISAVDSAFKFARGEELEFYFDIEKSKGYNDIELFIRNDSGDFQMNMSFKNPSSTTWAKFLKTQWYDKELDGIVTNPEAAFGDDDYDEYEENPNFSEVKDPCYEIDGLWTLRGLRYKKADALKLWNEYLRPICEKSKKLVVFDFSADL